MSLDGPYDAILFDNDGVLTELTETAVLETAARKAFADVGATDPHERHVTAAAEDYPDGLATIGDEYGVDLAEFWEARERRAVELQCAAVRDGTKPLYDGVDRLGDIEQPLGIVSNNQQATVEFVVDHHDLSDLFAHVCGREPTLPGMERRKPNPHYLEDALDALDAGTALYVGDSESDVVAARRAGLDSAFLRREHRRDVRLDRDPTVEVDCLGALVDEVIATD